MGPGQPEAPQPVSFPFISEQTRQTLLSELSLDIDPRSAQMIGEISGQQQLPPYRAIAHLTETVFISIMTYNSDFVTAIFNGLKVANTFSDGSVYRYRMDPETKGMAVVLQAFNLESGQRLFESLNHLEAEDLENIQQTIRETINPVDKAGEIPILERVLKGPRISEHQVNLNHCLTRAAEREGSIYPQEVVVGGVAMYRILSQVWPKISPHMQ